MKHLRSPKDLRTRKERKAAGKALRDKCPRRSNAVWRAPRNRRDPVELLVQSSKDRIPNLIPIRYGRMMQSPFAFYRGAAVIMASDLALMPTSGIRVQACGDCHLMNFGGFGTPSETSFLTSTILTRRCRRREWDLKRLAVSLSLPGAITVSRKRNRVKPLYAAFKVITNICPYADMGALEMWYQRMECGRIYQK